MPLLFSYGTLQYGTLQKEQVQMETFGRLLTGSKDALPGYKLEYIEIVDPEVLRKSAQKYHPIIRYTGLESDIIEGVLFEVTDSEIIRADEYEVANYKRIETIFASGKKGFIYIENETPGR
jgi:hypothetical protein